MLYLRALRSGVRLSYFKRITPDEEVNGTLWNRRSHYSGYILKEEQTGFDDVLEWQEGENQKLLCLKWESEWLMVPFLTGQKSEERLGIGQGHLEENLGI